MIDANARILEQPGDVVDRGVIGISVERRLARVRARVREIGGGNDGCLGCSVADEPVTSKIVTTTPCQ